MERGPFYVLTSQMRLTGEATGGEARQVFLDRAEAELFVAVFERTVTFEDGDDITDTTVTTWRVMTPAEVEAEFGPENLRRIEESTQIMLAHRLRDRGLNPDNEQSSEPG